MCGRNISHTVPMQFVDGRGFAFAQQRTHLEGTRVVCVAVAEVEDGLITRQTASQTWDG